MDQVQENQDFSQKTIIVLVILTVLISVFGTVAVLNEASSIKTETGIQESKEATGKVRLEILNPNAKNDDNINSATGRVALNILPQK